MCMTALSLSVFLNIIGPDRVSTEPGFITIHATEGPVLWVQSDEMWCTQAPQTDRMAQFIVDPAA